MTALQEIPLRRIDGSKASLKDFAGQVLLVVNVASKCGLTPQYAGLEQLSRKYKDQGRAVLGFPANDFGAQEPGSNQDIIHFCTTRFGVDFPMFEKISVKGEAQHPLYKELISQQPQAQSSDGGSLRSKLEEHGLSPKAPTDVTWNFEKFLVDRQGNVTARFAPDVEPQNLGLTAAIERELAKL
jgi:glutathione peroxidase